MATRRLEWKSAPPAWRTALGFAAALALLGAILSPLLRAAWQEMKELNPLYGFFSPHYSHLESWEQRISAGSGFGVLEARLYSDIRQQLLEAVK